MADPQPQIKDRAYWDAYYDSLWSPSPEQVYTDSLTQESLGLTPSSLDTTSKGPSIYDKDQHEETNLKDIESEVIGADPKEIIKKTLVDPSNADEEKAKTDMLRGNKNTVRTKTVGETAESLLGLAMSGKDTSSAIHQLIDTDLVIKEVHGRAYGPFQLYDRYSDDNSIELHGKPVSELDRMQQYQLTKFISTKEGWQRWDAYRNGTYAQFMPNGKHAVDDTQLAQTYNVPVEEIELLRNLFGDEWHTARAVMIAESGTELLKGVDNIITEGIIEVPDVPATMDKKIKSIETSHQKVDKTTMNPFAEKEKVKSYITEDGKLVEIPGDSLLTKDEEIKLRLDSPKDYELYQASGLGDMSEEEYNIMETARQWVESGDFQDWWSGMTTTDKTLLTGIVKHSLGYSLLKDANHKYLLDYALGFAKEKYGQDITWQEEALSPVVGFLFPTDWFAFSKFAKGGAFIMKPMMDNAYKKLIAKGISEVEASKLIVRTWQNMAVRAGSMASGLGGYNTAVELVDMLKAGGIEGNEFSAGQLAMTFTKNAGLGATTGVLGHYGGRMIGAIGSWLGPRAGTAGTTFGDFVTEALVFTIGGEAIGNPEKWIDTEAVHVLFTEDGKLAHNLRNTSMFLATMKVMHTTTQGFKARDIRAYARLKQTEADTKDDGWNPEQIELNLRERIIEKIADRNSMDKEEVKDVIEQMSLFPEGSEEISRKVSMEVKTKDLTDAILEVAEEMGIQRDINVKEMYNEIKNEVENGEFSSSKSKQIAIELIKNAQNTKKKAEATGTVDDIAKKRNKNAHKAEQKEIDTKKTLSEDKSVKEIRFSGTETATPNDKLRDAVNRGDVSEIIDIINSLNVINVNRVSGKEKTLTGKAKHVQIKKQIKSIIEDMRSIGEGNRKNIESVRELKSIGRKRGKKAGKHGKRYEDWQEAQKAEETIYNQYEQLLIELSKPKPNIKGANILRDGISKGNEKLRTLNVAGYEPIKVVKLEIDPVSRMDDYKKENNYLFEDHNYSGQEKPPTAVKYPVQILYTTEPTDKDIKVTREGKKVSPEWIEEMKVIKPFNSLAEAKKSANSVLGNAYPHQHRQHFVRYWQDKSGKFHYRLERGKLAPSEIETKIRPTLMDKDRANARINSDYGSGDKEYPDRLLPPQVKMSTQMRIERFDRNLLIIDSQINNTTEQIARLKKLKTESLLESGTNKQEKAMATARYQNKINMQTAGLKHAKRVQKQYLREKKRVMELGELVDETRKRMEQLSLGAGALGYFDKAVWKQMGKDVKSNANNFKDLLKSIWSKAPHSMRMKKKDFINWLGDQGLKDVNIQKFLEKGKNYEHMKDEAFLENALDVNRKLEEASNEHGPGAPENKRRKDRQGEYIGALALDQIKDPMHYQMIKTFYGNLGVKFDQSIRGTTTDPEITKSSVSAENQKLVADIILKGRLEPNKEGQLAWKNDHASMNWSGMARLMKTNLGVASELLLANPENPFAMEIYKKHLFAVIRASSEAGRTLREFRLPSDKLEGQLKDIMEQLDPTLKGFDKQIKSGDDVIRAMYDLMINDPNVKPKTSAKLTWGLAEIARNMKLFSGSSYAKSVVGNTTSSALETLVKLATPLTSWMIDPTRKYSGITLRAQGIAGYEQLQATFGPLNFLNPALYIAEARARGLGAHATLYQSMFGPEGAYKMAGRILAENSEALAQNPWLYNEGFSKHIPSITIGEFYKKVGWSTKGMNTTLMNYPIGGGTLRTFQNLHGALDVTWRLPSTQVRLNELMSRTAVKSLKKDGIQNPTTAQILKRTAEVREDKSAMDLLTEESKEYGAYVVFQERLQSQFMRDANLLRIKQTGTGAGFVNYKIPFLITRMNGLKKFAEYSPAGMIMWKGRNAWARAGVFGEARLNRKYHSPRISPDRDLLAEVSARALVGTGLWYLLGQAMFSIDKGEMWGSMRHLSKENRDLLASFGAMEYSAKFGDTWFPWRGQAEPVSEVMSAMSDFVQATQDEKPALGSALGKAIWSFTISLADNPVFMPFTDLFKVFGSQSKSPSWLAMKWSIGEFVPTYMNQLYSLEVGALKRGERPDITQEQTGVVSVIADWIANDPDNDFDIREFDKSQLTQEFARVWQPVRWSLGLDGQIDRRYVVSDLFGQMVPRSKDKVLGMLGIKTMPAGDPNKLFVQKEYERLFVNDQETLTYMTGEFKGAGETFTLSNDELNLVHIASGQIYRHTMENIMNKQAYQRLADKGVYKPIVFTEDQIANLTKDERANLQRDTETRAKWWREIAREKVWRKIHTTVKDITRGYYLGEIHNMSAMKSAIKNATVLTDTLYQFDDENASSELDRWEGMLREVVFEKDTRTGKYTEDAIKAREDVTNVKHFLQMKDPEYNQMAENILRKYSKNSVHSRFLINIPAIDGIIGDMHGFINSEQFSEQAGQIIQNINKDIKERQEATGELPWYKPTPEEFEGVSP